MMEKLISNIMEQESIPAEAAKEVRSKIIALIKLERQIEGDKKYSNIYPGGSAWLTITSIVGNTWLYKCHRNLVDIKAAELTEIWKQMGDV